MGQGFMDLQELISVLDVEKVVGPLNRIVKGLTYDSRKAKIGFLFVAISGFRQDGHNFIPEAVRKGARVMVVEKEILSLPPEVTLIRVRSSREALAKLSSYWYGFPSRELKLIGITGTNGKTTTTYLVESILKKAGYKMGRISTINYDLGSGLRSSRITTPESQDLQKMLRKMVDAGVDYAVIEVSSPRVAEVAKLADNLYRAMNIGFANELGLICEKLNIDAYEMVSSVNEAYARTNLFKPGLGAAGPCLAKDPQILNYYARQKGLDTELIGACISVNKKVNSRISSVVSRYLQEKNLQSPKIAIVGLAFKGFPETDDLRGSPALEIVANLKKEFSQCRFSYHDPIVNSFLGNIPVSSIGECIKDSNVVLFLTNHPSLMNIEVNQILERAARPLLIVDCWHNISNPAEISQQQDVEIVRIGDGRV